MRQPTKLEKAVARFLNDEYPQDIRMNRYEANYRDTDLYIAEMPNNPWGGIISYSTIGLSDYIHHSGDMPIRIEIIGACLEGVENYGNVVAGCAFHSIQNKNIITYGSCIQGLIDDYNISSCLSHITFVNPFLWQNLPKKSIDDVDIFWLMALPISSTEAEYLSMYGIDALEGKLAEVEADVMDFERSSVV